MCLLVIVQRGGTTMMATETASSKRVQPPIHLSRKEELILWTYFDSCASGFIITFTGQNLMYLHR